MFFFPFFNTEIGIHILHSSVNDYWLAIILNDKNNLRYYYLKGTYFRG